MAVFQKGLFQGGGEFQVDWDKALADAGFGADQLALLAGIPGFDAAIGGEAMQLGLPFGDSAVGAEALSLVAMVPLFDAAEGTESLDPNPNTPVAQGDPAVGSDVLALTAHVPMADAAVGSDLLIRTFQGGYKPRPGGGGGSSARAYIEKGFEGVKDEATGGELFTLEALLAARDAATGKDVIEVDKHYPQLSAFHLLIAC